MRGYRSISCVPEVADVLGDCADGILGLVKKKKCRHIIERHAIVLVLKQSTDVEQWMSAHGDINHRAAFSTIAKLSVRGDRVRDDRPVAAGKLVVVEGPVEHLQILGRHGIVSIHHAALCQAFQSIIRVSHGMRVVVGMSVRQVDVPHLVKEIAVVHSSD